MEIIKRKSIFCETKGHCYLSSKDDYMEITEWTNGDGFDVNISNKNDQLMFNLTHGQFKLLKKMYKKLNNE